MRRPAWSTIPTLTRNASVVAALLLVAPPTRAQQLPNPGRDDGDFAPPDKPSPPVGQRVHFGLDFQGVPGCDEPGLFVDTMRFHFWNIQMLWDPFAPVSPWPLKVRVTRSRGWFAGTIDLERPNGPPFHHEMRGPSKCYVVLSGLASSISSDLVMMYPPRRKPELACPESKPESVSPACVDSRNSVWPAEWPLPALEKPKPDPPRPYERAPIAVRIGATAWPELIANGWGSFGISVEAGVRYHAVSLGVEAHGDPPLGAVSYAQLGAVSFARLSGALLLCGHWGWFTGCGVGDAGRFLFPNHIHALPASAPYDAAGVRANLEFPVAPPRIFLRVGVDVRAPIHPGNYNADAVTIFKSAGLGFGFGLGLVAELPQ
jgi:hypothetical protein